MATTVSTDMNLALHDVISTGKEIGWGAYGRVFEVDYQGTLCAAKEIHALLLQFSQDHETGTNKIVTDFLNECEIWSTIRHPCVVQFLGLNYAPILAYYLMHFPLTSPPTPNRAYTGAVVRI